MTSLITIKSELSIQLTKICEQLGLQPEIEFTKTQDPTHGDFATNLALKEGKKTGQNPVELAQKIISAINLPPELVSVTVAGPGFINFKLSSSFLLSTIFAPTLSKLVTDPELVIVEYSQPNVAKPLGVHHLLSTVIGQSVYNILKATGHNVLAWNYIGDWGTQFGKLIYAYKSWGNKEEIEKDPIKGLLKLYVDFHSKAETDETLEDLGRAEFKKLEQGDSENKAIWEWVIEVSKKDFMHLYALLGGIQFDTYEGEASLEPFLTELLEEGKKAKIFVEGEKESYIVNLDTENLPPLLVQKSDGATLYATRDIACVKERIKNYKPHKIIYVVDMAQSLHFKQFFATCKKFEWFKKELELFHLSFGRMSFKDKKMSTRKGNIIYLEEVINEAIERAAKIIQEKNPDLPDKENVARVVGIGSLKYSVLNQSPETNVIFDWDKILSFEGNSAPYLQYSYARAKSILRNTNVKVENTDYTDFNAEEELLLRQFAKFQEVVLESAQKLKPNLIATYLFELAQSFNSFYAKHKVSNEPNQQIQMFRLNLISKFAEVIKTGLNLLAGIEVVEEL